MVGFSFSYGSKFKPRILRATPAFSSNLPRHDIPACLNWHLSQAGLDRDIFAQASIDLLAQSAWFIAARAAASSIEPDHVHQAIKLVPSAHAKITQP